jgi:hypothetical protein
MADLGMKLPETAVDDQLVFLGRLYGKIGGLRSAKNAIDVVAALPEQVIEADAIREEASAPEFGDARCAYAVRLNVEIGHGYGYLITSLARIRIDAGIATPSPFAVLRLTANSNCVGCSTGRSAGFVPSSTFTSCRASWR